MIKLTDIAIQKKLDLKNQDKKVSFLESKSKFLIYIRLNDKLKVRI